MVPIQSQTRGSVKHVESNEEARRLTAPEIFHAAVESAREELARSNRTLFFSGLAGGVTLGLTALSVSAVRALLGNTPSAQFISFLFYPIGFIAVIIGRAQLFTENTLYPVILTLDEHRHFRSTLRLWGVVYASNVLGALLFAVLAIRSEALPAPTTAQLIEMGVAATQGTATTFFWSGIIGGWLIALVAWVVTASQWTIGQLAMVWLLTFLVGIGRFAHCIVGTGEILSAVVAHALPFTAYLHWVWAATLGNIVGGVVIVSLLNYGQVRAG